MLAAMPENPYESPKSPNDDATGRRNLWRRACFIGVGLALVAFACLVLLALFRPFGLLDTGPSTPAKRRIAGVAFALNLTMYGAALSAVVSSIGWGLTSSDCGGR